MTGVVSNIKKAEPGIAPTPGMGTGYGFIEDDATGVAYFFHKRDVLTGFNRLEQGHRVEFEEQASERGPRACRVRQI